MAEESTKTREDAQLQAYFKWRARKLHAVIFKRFIGWTLVLKADGFPDGVLTSRELAAAAGVWLARLIVDIGGAHLAAELPRLYPRHRFLAVEAMDRTPDLEGFIKVSQPERIRSNPLWREFLEQNSTEPIMHEVAESPRQSKSPDATAQSA